MTTTAICPGYPVNSAGEVVAEAGTAGTVVIGTINEGFIPVNPITGAMVIAGLGSGGTTGTPTAITTSRAIVSGDNGNTLVNSTATNIALTINTGMPSGFGFAAAQMSTGTVSFTAGAGVTINNISNYTKTGGQYAVISLLQVATNTYLLVGSGAV